MGRERVSVAAFAPAKINLYLHVVGRRPDGYHLLDSLVGFADIGDRITATPAASLSLDVGGPEGAALAGLGAENLVMRAALRLAERLGGAVGAALHLEKNLPTASGVGGGSSDAAAALRALVRLWRPTIDDACLAALAAKLGADVPVCLLGRAAWVGGAGELLTVAADIPPAGIVLANPRHALATADVFRAHRAAFGADGRFAPMPRHAADLARLLAQRENGLTAAAMALVPEIGAVLDRLAALPDSLLARMSGSGATCFALFDNRFRAERACAALAAAEPGWWCAAGALMTQPVQVLEGEGLV